MKNRTFSNGTVHLLDGTYRGTFSGYQVSVKVKPAIAMHPSHAVTVSFATFDGIRGEVQCKVTVLLGKAIVEW